MDEPPTHYEFIIPAYLDKVGLTGEAQQGANNNLEQDGAAVRIGCGPGDENVDSLLAQSIAVIKHPGQSSLGRKRSISASQLCITVPH